MASILVNCINELLEGDGPTIIFVNNLKDPLDKERLDIINKDLIANAMHITLIRLTFFD